MKLSRRPLKLAASIFCLLVGGHVTPISAQVTLPATPTQTTGLVFGNSLTTEPGLWKSIATGSMYLLPPNSLSVKSPGQLDLLVGPEGYKYWPGFYGQVYANSTGSGWGLNGGYGNIISHQPAASSTLFLGNVFGFGSIGVDGSPATIMKYVDGGHGTIYNQIGRDGAIWNFSASNGPAGVQLLSGNGTAGIRVVNTLVGASPRGNPNWPNPFPGNAQFATDTFTCIQLGAEYLPSFILPNLGIGTSNPTVKLDVLGNTKITGNLDISGSGNTIRIDNSPVLTQASAAGNGIATLAATSRITAPVIGAGTSSITAGYVFQAAGDAFVSGSISTTAITATAIGSVAMNTEQLSVGNPLAADAALTTTSLIVGNGTGIGGANEKSTALIIEKSTATSIGSVRFKVPVILESPAGDIPMFTE